MVPQRLQGSAADRVSDLGRKPDVALYPGANRGAVLEQEEEAENRHRDEERQRGEALYSAGEPVDQGPERIARSRADVLVRGLGLSVAHPEVLDPALDFVGPVAELMADRGGLGADAAKDQIAGENPGADDQQQHQCRTERARQAVAGEQIHELPRDGGDHPGDDDGDQDHLGQGGQPDHTRQEDDDADQQPGGESRVA